MEPVIIIPARRASSRFPDKLLALIGDKPLIRCTVEAALDTGYRVVVATDCEEIGEAAGAEYALTPGPFINGTERCLHVVQNFMGNLRPMIINWQGDSPLTRPEWVKELAQRMDDSPCGVGTLQQFVDREALNGEVQVEHGYDEHMACGFARMPAGHRLAYRHIGIYAIKPEAMQFYGRTPSRRELQMDLEQLRWLDRGVAIAAIKAPDEPAIEVNFPEDLAAVLSIMEGRHALG